MPACKLGKETGKFAQPCRGKLRQRGLERWASQPLDDGCVSEIAFDGIGACPGGNVTQFGDPVEQFVDQARLADAWLPCHQDKVRPTGQGRTPGYLQRRPFCPAPDKAIARC